MRTTRVATLALLTAMLLGLAVSCIGPVHPDEYDDDAAGDDDDSANQ